MPNLNNVMLMGNLTRAPEIRQLPTGSEVCNFSIATSRKWKTKDGESQEETIFVDCAAFGKQAAVINQYVGKGDPIYVSGRLKMDKWQDKATGANRSKLSVVVDRFEFLKSKGDDGPTPAFSPSKAEVVEAQGEDHIPF